MIPENVKQIMQTLIDNNFKSYIIGGAVRDAFMGDIPNDFDVFTNASGEQILQLFPHGIVMGGEERQEKILTVIVNGIEVSQFRKSGDRTEVGGDLNTHLSTCDFTINSLCSNIDGQIMDKFGGFKDMYNKILRCVGNAGDRIQEDKLRILRAIRFVLKYNMIFDMDLQQEILNADLSSLPAERIREELFKIMKYKNSIKLLLSYGLLQKIIPEIKTLFIGGGEHHNEDVIDHCVYAFEHACEVTDNPVLKFAIFMHDIGKGETRDELEGRTIFYCHEEAGERIAGNVMNRLKFSNYDERFVKFIIRSHMFSYKDSPSKRSYINFFARMEGVGVNIEEYILVIYCDHQANLLHDRMKFMEFIKGNWLHKKYYELKHSKEPFTVKDLAVNGLDVIGLGFAAGPVIGQILSMVYDEVLDGKIKNSKPELLHRLRELENEHDTANF